MISFAEPLKRYILRKLSEMKFKIGNEVRIIKSSNNKSLHNNMLSSYIGKIGIIKCNKYSEGYYDIYINKTCTLFGIKEENFQIIKDNW